MCINNRKLRFPVLNKLKIFMKSSGKNAKLKIYMYEYNYYVGKATIYVLISDRFE